MTCYFATNKSAGGLPRHAAADLTTVTCDTESVKSIADYLEGFSSDIPLFECSPIELLFLRGNGEDLSEVSHPEEQLICKAHLDFLLLSWPNKTQWKTSTRKNETITHCALPHLETRAAGKEAAMRKDEVLKWLENKGELFHVGSAICSSHRTGILKGQYKTVGKVKRVPPKRTKDDNTDDMDFSLQCDEEAAIGSFSELEDDDDVPLTEPDSTAREQISAHFSSIAKLLGSNNYNTKRDWSQLSGDSKRRKISLVFAMFQMLCTLVAPGGASELEGAVSEKLSPRRDKDGDQCSKQVLSAISERILEAPNRRARIETLALIVDLPYFSSTKVLTTIPTVTRYLIHKARIFNCGGINFEETYTRVRYVPEAVDFFVSFIVRSNVLISLSWVNNFATKSDGSQVEMGVSVRLQSYIRIDRMYREELHKYNKDKRFTLSYGTVYKLLSSIVPRKNKRMTCVDEYAADAGESWCRLESYVNDLGIMGYFTTTEESELLRRVKLSRSFLEGAYRSHIEETSTVAEHCAMFALSDPKKLAYVEYCTHEHDSHCDECREVDHVLNILREKLYSQMVESNKKGISDRYKLERMHGMAEKCIRYICAYRSHIVRAVVSDSEKSRVIAALENNEAFVTADWAQKVLPQAAIESQSGYFGKHGISVHITHVYAKIDDQSCHHSFRHVFESSKQQSADVSAILRHVISVLKQKGITVITLRSDNAGSYKSAELIGDLYHIANESPRISRYIFSESQAGKGPCDRDASHLKRKIRESTESKRNVRDAKEVFDSQTVTEPVKGTSTYLCVMRAASKPKKSTIPDISTIFDITFEKEGILARKHCGIGSGLRTGHSKLNPSISTMKILEEGGWIEDKFWVSLGDSSISEGNDEKEREPNIDRAPSTRRDYECSTPGCIASFLLLRNLEAHEISGKHKFKSAKQSMLDYTIDALNEKVETLDVAQEGRANDSFVNSMTRNDSEFIMGWALKMASTDRISDLAYDEAASYFMSQRSLDPPRRAEPRAFSLMMENMKEPTGKYKFQVSELLSEKQLTGLFSRLEKKRVSGVSVARKARGRQSSKSNRKRTHPESSDEEKDDDDGFDVEENYINEEDVVMDCINNNYKDIFV